MKKAQIIYIINYFIIWIWIGDAVMTDLTNTVPQSLRISRASQASDIMIVTAITYDFISANCEIWSK